MRKNILETMFEFAKQKKLLNIFLLKMHKGASLLHIFESKKFYIIISITQLSKFYTIKFVVKS